MLFKFYSEAILSRRGPLAKVWLAAHMERKLSKAQTLQTDIEQSVGAHYLNYRTASVIA
jgi:cohesin complex subunit SCC1